MKYFVIGLFSTFIALTAYAQPSGPVLKYPLVNHTFREIKQINQKYTDSSLFVLFVRSLDSVFNFNQTLSKNKYGYSVQLFDSVINFPLVLSDDRTLSEKRNQLLKTEEVSNDLIFNKEAQSIDKYCNVIEPKINYVLSRYKININCDYFLANFLVSLTCQTCWVFNHNDYTRLGDDSYDFDLPISKMAGMKTVIYKDILVSDSILLRGGTQIIKAENIPAQILPYGMLLKLLISRRDTTTNFLLEYENKVSTLVYQFNKDTLKDFKYSIIHDSIGVLKLNTLEFSGVTASIRKTLITDSTKIKKLIIDIRQCPGGLLIEAIRFCDLFLEEGYLIGEWTSFNQSASDKNESVSHPDKVLPGVKLFLLTDTLTSSGAEIIAGVLKEYKKATVIGQGTAGNGEVRKVKYLEGVNNYYITLNAFDYLIAKKYNLGTDSILPDIYVGTDKKSDTVFQKAVRMSENN